MFERFSRSYYLGRLYVTPDDRRTVAMDRTQHERLNEELYATGEGIEPLDAPLVMKLESRHLPVHGDDAVPANTLALPSAVVEDMDVRNPPSLREVLLASRERARQLLQFAGYGAESARLGEDPSESGSDGPVGT